jgi:hypothetical protein
LSQREALENISTWSTEEVLSLLRKVSQWFDRGDVINRMTDLLRFPRLSFSAPFTLQDDTSHRTSQVTVNPHNGGKHWEAPRRDGERREEDHCKRCENNN